MCEPVAISRTASGVREGDDNARFGLFLESLVMLMGNVKADGVEADDEEDDEDDDEDDVDDDEEEDDEDDDDDDDDEAVGTGSADGEWDLARFLRGASGIIRTCGGMTGVVMCPPCGSGETQFLMSL